MCCTRRPTTSPSRRARRSGIVPRTSRPNSNLWLPNQNSLMAFSAIRRFFRVVLYVVLSGGELWRRVKNVGLYIFFYGELSWTSFECRFTLESTSASACKGKEKQGGTIIDACPGSKHNQWLYSIRHDESVTEVIHCEAVEQKDRANGANALSVQLELTGRWAFWIV